jgi:hypothetical protein
MNSNQIRSVKLIGYEHILILASSKLLVCKVNYDSWTVTLVSTTDVSANTYFILIDQLNEFNFAIYGRTQIITGTLIGDRIVLNPYMRFDDAYIVWANLIGSCFSGFRCEFTVRDGVEYWKYCNIDLVTLTEQTFEVPFRVNGQLPSNVCLII